MVNHDREGEILVLGDAHADDPENRRALFAAYEAADADVALQVGDLGWYDVPIPTWFVAGNNDDQDVVDALRRGDASLSRVGAGGGSERSTRPRLLSSTAVTVRGLRVTGLSGNYSPTRYEKSREELVGGRRRHFVRDEVERAAALSDVDVFLAHEAPHGLVRADGYDPARTRWTTSSSRSRRNYSSSATTTATPKRRSAGRARSVSPPSGSRSTRSTRGLSSWSGTRRPTDVERHCLVEPIRPI